MSKSTVATKHFMDDEYKQIAWLLIEIWWFPAVIVLIAWLSGVK